MTPERWRQVDKLLQSALERPPAERASFLNTACQGDEALRNEVETLLASASDADGFLESPAVQDAATLLIDSNAKRMIPRQIGPYEILSLLGAGGMGEVYLAKDTRLGRKVALKLLPQFFVDDQNRVERFKREARTASALNHPNVATIYEIGQDQQNIYIAMEYVEGRTLAEEISGEPMPLAATIEIAAQIADALDAAHSKGITHRDIKSQNIMVSDRGHVTVLDFGLAKIRPDSQLRSDESATIPSTATGIVMGTVQYMSPEQALGRTLDHRTDIFSLGVVLYEMITGRLPFCGKSATETIERIVHQQPEALARFNYDVPFELERIVKKCLEKDHDRRYQSAKEVLIDLKNLKRDSDSGTAVITAVVARTAGQKLKLPLLFLGVLIVIGAGLYLLVNNKRADKVAGPSEQSIAVLPFKPLATGPRDESLEMGIADSLITRLSAINDLNVRPLSAVRKYADQQDPINAGREQQTATVVDGSIQRVGNRVRVTVRLIRVSDGRQLWASQFDENFIDILAVEDSISGQVAAALAVKLTGTEKELLTKHYTEDAEAYALYLKGRYFWNKRTAEAVAKSINYFNDAIRRDQQYALAYVGLADAYLVLPNFSESQPKEMLPKAREAAQAALRLDNSLPEAHTTLAAISADFDWNWIEAESQFKQAIQMNPNYATAHQWYGEYLDHAGRQEDAIKELTKAQQLDPLSLIINTSLGQAYYDSRQYDQAIAQLRKALDLDSTFVNAHLHLGLVYLQKKMYAQSIVELQKAKTGSGDAPNIIALLGVVEWVSGNRVEGQTVFERLEHQGAEARDMAIIYTGIGDKDHALTSLEKAYQDHSWLVLLLKSDPYFDVLRSDARFQDLIAKIGL